MVETQLTAEMIEAGEALIKRLDESKIKPDAVFWFYFSDIEAWRLVIAEYKLGEVGPQEAYRELQRVLRAHPEETKSLSLDNVAMARPHSPLVALLRIAIKTGPGISDIRFTNNVINGTVVEDAYIYRL